MNIDPLYLNLAIIVFVINVVPVFMPPTWTILTFFYLHFHLALLPTVIIGATTATVGRVVLATLAKQYFRPFFSREILGNYDALGQFLHKHQHLTIPIILTYAFFPISSNQVFIVAGLTKLKLKIIAFSFLFGRLISYTFWISAASHISKTLEDVFLKHFSDAGTLVFEISGLLVILLIGKINWEKVLKIKK